MKHCKIDSTVAADEPIGVGQTLLSQSVADQSTGISAAQAALAASNNVLMGDVDRSLIIEMAVNFIETSSGRKPNRLSKSIAAIAAKRRRDQIEFGQYRPHRTIGNDVDHQSYIDHLLSPSDNAYLRYTLSATCPGNLSEKHPKNLDALRAQSWQAKDNVYKLVIAGDLATVLKASRDGKLESYDRDFLVDVVRNQARCYAIRTAHMRVEVLRDYSTAPAGTHFAGFKQWLLVGHVCMATIAAPARVIQRLAAFEAAGVFDGLDEEGSLDRLTQHKILPSDAGREILDIARTVRRCLSTRRRGRGNYNFGAALSYVTRGSTFAAALNRGDMRLEGLTRLDFAEYRIGLSASEAASYVALSLLRALPHIDVCIEAILADMPIPMQSPLKIAKDPLAFTSVILRTEGQCDRNAPKIDGQPTALGHELDRDRKAGRIPLNSMLGKLKNPATQKQAFSNLRIDASLFFER